MPSFQTAKTLKILILFVYLLYLPRCVLTPGLLILLNTFAGPVLFAVGLPLVLFWPQIPNRVLGTENKSGRQSSKGEFDWIESPDQLRTRMFRLVIMYQALHGVKVCIPATKHHRYLSFRSAGI